MALHNIAVIGSGISGLSVSKMLLEAGMQVNVFEKQDKKGGLIKCDRIDGNLFHCVGGHVFNSKNQDVLKWFWSYFDRDKEFFKVKRNAKIWLAGKYTGYPIENFLYNLPDKIVGNIIADLLDIERKGQGLSENNFEDFLLSKFGKTLYEIYFKPYNKKIWNCDLSKVPLNWLNDKLPLPDIQSILISNIVREENSEMVHSIFYYPKENGSQFIADRLSEGVNIHLNYNIKTIELISGKWLINGAMHFDAVIYCGDVRELYKICRCPGTGLELENVKNLRSNGTSNMFCETDITDISWLYIPEETFKAHRIIYTGSFSPSNNRGSGRMTCVVEFSGIQDIELMRSEIKRLPGNLKELACNFEPDSYIIHFENTKEKIQRLKEKLTPHNFFLLGRFAEWEYYNMDKAIERAMEVRDTLTL